MPGEYVEERDGDFYVAGSRVSLASIIHEFRDGASPETIRQYFPSLSLAQVYGSIAFFLNHPEESELYLRRLNRKWEELEQKGQPPSEELQKKLKSATVSGVVRRNAKIDFKRAEAVPLEDLPATQLGDVWVLSARQAAVRRQETG